MRGRVRRRDGGRMYGCKCKGFVLFVVRKSSGSESNRSFKESELVLLIGVGKVFANCLVIG